MNQYLENILYVFLTYLFGGSELIIGYFFVFFDKGERIYYFDRFYKWVYMPRNLFMIRMSNLRWKLEKYLPKKHK